MWIKLSPDAAILCLEYAIKTKPGLLESGAKLPVAIAPFAKNPIIVQRPDRVAAAKHRAASTLFRFFVRQRHVRKMVAVPTRQTLFVRDPDFPFRIFRQRSHAVSTQPIGARKRMKAPILAQNHSGIFASN